MKKKWFWIGGVLLAVIIAVVVVGFIGNRNEPIDDSLVMEDPFGIEYFTVPPMEQVYVNGIVKPEQSQDFNQETTLGTKSDLQVENGQVVEKDTLLYSYTNEELLREISKMTSEAARLETQRANTAYKQQLAIDRWYAASEEERENQTLDEIYMEFNIPDIDSQIQEAYTMIADLEAEAYTEVLAPFKGKVVIPEEITANAPLMKLISEKFYVSGTLNEKDLEKVKVDQAADITVVSNNFTTRGKVSFVDTTPADSETDAFGGASTMSSYPVKLDFDSLEGIVNGYHVQATIQLKENQVWIPAAAIHTEGEKSYVLVNDFGTVAKRVIQLGKEKDQEVEITSGLEAEDEIIVSSKEKVQEGDILDPNMTEVSSAEEE